MKAIFIDRDGTLIEDRGFLSRPEQVVFYNNTFSALSRLKEQYQLFIVTNQSCISGGQVTSEDVDNVNAYVVKTLASENIPIAEVYTCPHVKEDLCLCRKPKPYFLHQAGNKYNLDLTQCYTIGDHYSDVKLGENVGGKGIYVLTGHGTKHHAELKNETIVAKDIEEAADYIIADTT